MNIQQTFASSEPGNGAPLDVARAVANCDASLVAQAQSGSSFAFGELYERHRVKIYRATLRILRNQQDAEDAVQRTFQRAFTNLARFRGDSTFSTWVNRIAINEALMLLRARRSSLPILESRAETLPGQGGVEVAASDPSPEEILCASERRAALLQAVARLRKSLRIIVHHRELQGLTNEETAQLLGLSVSAVKARTFHARKFLKKHFARKFAKTGPLIKLERRLA